MNETPNDASQNDVLRIDPAAALRIEPLMADLTSDNGQLRERARTELVTIGPLAVPSLIMAVAHPNKNVRWEATKALGEIGDPSAADALVAALEDDIFDVRWLAAEGLIRLGPTALEPLLQALTVRSESLWLRQGAHHILSHFAKKDTKAEHHELGHPHRVPPGLKELAQPLFDALNDVASPMTVPVAARMLLDKLKAARS
jgi:hypothetical protein